ncbi:MAG: signal recognition particle [Coxiella sp. DG_40]|nr:MAG: signal recognition particle [Coxiella sp. DG_40]
MFDNLSEKLTRTIRNLTGRGRLTEDNVKETLRDLRRTLLEADVALPIIKQFIEDISNKAIGQEVMKSLKPGEALVKIVRDELINIMGNVYQDINLTTQPPTIILISGLQGSGKTTSVAKLAYFIKENKKKSALITTTDIYRPAAIEQLETLAKQIDTAFFHISQRPIDIVKAAIFEAKKKFIDVVIIDTAGRLHIDKEMMDEISNIHKAINPTETLFVVDSMAGQDAANTAKTFNDILPLTGVILTKTDGDARGGAALSVRMITGKPIKFIGVGEKINAFEPFHPDRIVSRILGMGDILTLVEEAEKNVNREKAKKLAQKISKGKGFNLEDFKDQLQQLKKLGGINNLLTKIPGMGMLPKAAKNMVNDDMFIKMEAIINSMTLKERYFPAIIKGSRKRRIATGSGTEVQDVNRLLKQFSRMQKMMKHFKSSKMMNMMRDLQKTT